MEAITMKLQTNPKNILTVVQPDQSLFKKVEIANKHEIFDFDEDELANKFELFMIKFDEIFRA